MKSSPREPLAILVVDDDGQMLKTIADILRLRGHEPHSAATAKLGLEVAQESPPAVALIDLRLPDMDGIDLVARLHELSALTEVVILTGNASVDSAVRALREQSYDYLIKPVQPEALLSTVDRAGERWQRRRAETELRATEARYRQLVETAQEGIWTIDASERTDYVNPRMAAMLGYEPAEMYGRPIFEFMDAGPREEAEKHLERRRRGIQETYELRLRRKDGVSLSALISASTLLDEAGTYSGALAMVTDITERKGLEDQLRQAQKMEAIGRLAGGVAHDFNNMLTAIKSYASMLQADLEPGDRRRDDAEEIEKAADRAAALTRQLLAFSRQQVLKPQILDLNATIEGIESMLRRLIGADVEVGTQLDAELGLVKADPGQLEQVLMNLAVNARDAMPAGGALTIQTLNVTVNAQFAHQHGLGAPGDYVLIRVADTGHGMDRTTLERIFDPFFTTKAPGKGTGLGLSTVFGIVKQSGGYVGVDSEPGAGTIFNVYLPRVTDDATPAQLAPPVAIAGGGTGTILLVEDDAAVRLVAGRVLSRLGYEVIGAANGADALAICDRPEQRVDLVMTDMVMPEMGGAELAREILMRRPGARILFMSGYSEDAVRAGGSMADGAAFIEKPFTPDALAAKVLEVLGAQGYRRPTAPGERSPSR